MEEILSWPSTSVWGRVAHMLDACGRLCDYRDAPKKSVFLMCFLEDFHLAHHKKESSWLLPWSGLYCGQFCWPPIPKCRLMHGVENLKDELRLEKNEWVSINLQASGLADKVGEQVKN